MLRVEQGNELEYYGGLTPSGISRIPHGTAYSNIKRTHLPEISKKIKKSVQESGRDEVNKLFAHFCDGELKVAWHESKYDDNEWFTLECYVEDNDTPVVMIAFPKKADPKSAPMGLSTIQSPQWDRILSQDEKYRLAILMSQRFLRKLGYLVHEDFLGHWSYTLVQIILSLHHKTFKSVTHHVL